MSDMNDAIALVRDLGLPFYVPIFEEHGLLQISDLKAQGRLSVEENLREIGAIDGDCLKILSAIFDGEDALAAGIAKAAAGESDMFSAKRMATMREVQRHNAHSATVDVESEDSEVGDNIGAFLDEIESDEEEEEEAGATATRWQYIRISQWCHDDCINWLRSIGHDTDRLMKMLENEGASLSGELLLQASQSTRELRETFGLDTMADRLAFEKALSQHTEESRSKTNSAAAVAAGTISPDGGATLQNTVHGTSGGVYSDSFMECVRPLYDLHMGVENMAPLLYSLVRFVKPASVLEVGAGYTSVFILQALRDNELEMRNYHRLWSKGVASVPVEVPLPAGAGTAIRQVPWLVDDEMRKREGSNEEAVDDSRSSGSGSGNGSGSGSGSELVHGVLECVDNMAHEHTTAHHVLRCADQLGIAPHLHMHVTDAWEFGPVLMSVAQTYTHAYSALVIGKIKGSGLELGSVDFMWIDFGVGMHWQRFFDRYWPYLSGQGGLLLVHSTLTNELTRSWLDPVRFESSASEKSAETSSETGETTKPTAAAPPAPPATMAEAMARGELVTVSLLEPHKMFQNSFSLFQKRTSGYAEHMLTKYP